MSTKTTLDGRVMRLFDGYVHGRITRREFLERVAAITASTATAAALLQSLSPDYALAQRVDPEDPSISANYRKYPSPKGAGIMRAYVVRPAVIAHRLPAVVVIHENRGLNPYIEDVARRLAARGLMACAPDALTPLGGYPGNDDDGRALQRQRNAEEMIEDFVAAVSFMQQHPDCTGRVGAVGFCFGGGMAMRLAVRIPDLAAAVAFYGRHPAETEAELIRTPLMLHHAGLDDRVNASWPDFRKGLDAAEHDYVAYEYAGANHGFHNDSTPRFDENAAELAWRRTVEFLRGRLALDV